MASTRKKLDEKHLKILRELVSLPGNKHCFDCHQRGPTYVNVTIGSFVCTTCSGILRGLTPPHRVKSISMATFSPEEVQLLRSRGNEYCKRVWLGLCDSEESTKDEQQIKDLMIAKYEKKRYYLEGAPVETKTVNGWSGPSSPSPPQTPAKPLPPPQTRNGVSLPLNGSSRKEEKREPFGPTETAQVSFANFDNNPIFTAPSTSPPIITKEVPELRDRSKVWATSNFHRNSWSSTLSSQLESIRDPWEVGPPSNLHNNRWSYGGRSTTEDRYAALKDLDSLMKTQMASVASTDWGPVMESRPEESPSTVNDIWSTQAAFPRPPPLSSNPFIGDNGSSEANSFVGNPFKSVRAHQEFSWGSSSGQPANGLPTSHSLYFGTTKLPWPTESTANPFSSSQQFVGCGSEVKLHHSSNPFL